MEDVEQQPAVLERQAARVIVVDEEDRVLLLHGRDPDRPEAGSWWFTPGGGLDEGETSVQAARRELFEETGIRVDELGSIVHQRSFELDFQGARYLQREVFFAARVANQAPSPEHWTEIERRVLLEARWCSLEELRDAGEPYYPENLIELVEALNADWR